MNNNRLSLSFLRLGEILPQWSLESIFGDELPLLEDYEGKAILILFFNLGCPGCIGRAIPFANRVVYERGDQMAVIGIHTNFTGIDYPLQEFAIARDKFFIRFPFYKDANFDTTFLDYGAGGTPHWILVDDRGIVQYSIFGSDPNNALLRLDYKIGEILTRTHE